MSHEKQTQKTTGKTQALIYTRVACNDGEAEAAHTRQEESGFAHAKKSGYEVAGVFRDTISGNMVSRPGMDDLLAYVREHGGGDCRVLVKGAARLARSAETHFALLEKLRQSGARLETTERGRDIEREPER